MDIMGWVFWCGLENHSKLCDVILERPFLRFLSAIKADIEEFQTIKGGRVAELVNDLLFGSGDFGSNLAIFI